MSLSRFYEALFHRAPIQVVIHIAMVVVAVLISILISIPCGIFLSREKYKKYSWIVINILNVFQTIPAFAFIAVSMPLLGLGYKPTIVVLVIQSLLPIARSTIVGLCEVNENIKEAAKGMGMSKSQILFQVELPLALPMIISGIKTSTVYVVSVATLGGFIGAGGLGVLISSGMSMLWPEFLIVGALLCAIIAISMDKFWGFIEKKIAV